MIVNNITPLRGLACILLVVYHVIGGSPDQGLHISNGFLRDANDILAYIRMPLFTFLSGYVYSLRPIGNYSSFLFLRSKARRLLLPMLTAGSLFAVIQYNIDATNIKTENIWLLHIVPVAHYWFVESLFIVFCFVIFFEKFNFINDGRRFAIIFVIATLMFCTISAPVYIGIHGALYLLPYFLFGLGVCRFNLKSDRFFVKMASFFVAVFVLGAIGLVGGAINRQTPVALCVGLIACYFLINLDLKSSFLSGIGKYSYGVYLYHVFFSASARMTIGLFTYDIALHLSVGVFSAIAGSIVLYKFLSKSPILSTLFLGKRFIRTKKIKMECVN
ncbi:acyltransferase family protein [Iodobacter fluviatilis]|uniref:Glucans biosynthesis protein n=1 Tax=Iodobacter fluviatilis TaxID=537 RepID=A0A377Q5D7_9NEIS|nr:acyltransferase [Iodobacter fluviatilis]TCU81500.1 surface polysaccharide O-acyltransferase-like enzyme [Iodobacter fluviatilis]STQ89930.1 glucans biosynthesis protein [Iodobacter fluviatilis]